jgi:hypothetical protein
MVALEATLIKESAVELRASYELRLGDERFTVDIDHGAIAIARGSARRADAVIVTDSATLRALVFEKRKLTGAPVDIQGDARLARTFFRLFARP